MGLDHIFAPLKSMMKIFAVNGLLEKPRLIKSKPVVMH